MLRFLICILLIISLFITACIKQPAEPPYDYEEPFIINADGPDDEEEDSEGSGNLRFFVYATQDGPCPAIGTMSNTTFIPAADFTISYLGTNWSPRFSVPNGIYRLAYRFWGTNGWLTWNVVNGLSLTNNNITSRTINLYEIPAGSGTMSID